MSRVLWKGAISFGLVNIPVALKPAAREGSLDLDMLDRRDMARIGYQRVNKRTGKVVGKDDIVKGYEYEKGEYVLLSDEDFRRANVEATQTVDIVSFVEAGRIPPYYFETPYYLEPDKRGDKGYVLLRETMRSTGRAALARVVIRNRQHLAALLVVENALVLNTMRFADEVAPLSDLRLPKPGAKGTGVGPREIDMAARLIEDMSEEWAPGQYKDTYRDDLMARIDEKVAAGRTHELTPADEGAAEPRQGAKVIDMMALLRQSIAQRGKGPEEARAADEGADEGADKRTDKPAGKTARKVARKVAKKAATKAAAKAATKAAEPAARAAKASKTAKSSAGRKAAARAAPRKRAA
ncbi:Ku protein [Cupriavidus sp. 30B13]|uniref:non-homologous end joining protein Ku n=1 Tax=Cupriavidus sp. 30B13 TaxID=3384241 RepID=UPI003B8EB8C0